MNDGRTGAPFKGWQWAEIVLAAVLVWTQVVVQVVFEKPLAAALLGLVLLGLLMHAYTWMIPLLRERGSSGSSSPLLNHGERLWVVLSGLGILLLGILMAMGAVLDLAARTYRDDVPGSTGLAVGALLLGFVLGAAGNIVVQRERIRVRRQTQ